MIRATASIAIRAVLACTVGCHAAAPAERASRGTIGATPPAIEPRTAPVSRRAAISSPPGQLAIVAATADGRAALTSDAFGGIRLWPTLDGEHEPMVVDLPAPRALAIASRADGFVAAEIDPVGGLVIARLDRDGRTRTRASLDPEPAFVDLAAADRGIVAARADSSIVVYDDDGRSTARLVTEPGERLVAIAIGPSHAVATIERAAGKRARIVELGAKPAWGEWLVLGDTVDVVAVSPSGKRIVNVIRDAKTPQAMVANVVDRSGKILGSQTVDPNSTIAFAADDRVAVRAPRDLSWLIVGPGGASSEKLVTLNVGLRTSVVAGGGRAIMPYGTELAITTDHDTQYLGYGFGSPLVAAAAPNGRLLVVVGDELMMLDSSLAAVPLPHAPALGSRISSVVALGGDDWLVQFANEGKIAIAIADLATGRVTNVGDATNVVGRVRYEPSSRLVTVSTSGRPAVVHRYDPARHTLDRVAEADVPRQRVDLDELFPVASARAGGVELVRVTRGSGALSIGWIEDAAALDRLAHHVNARGWTASVDATGRVYAWRNDKGLELVTYRDGKEELVVPTKEMVTAWPSPDGAHVALVAPQSIALADPRGERAWALPIGGTTEALWLDNRTIAVIGPSGIAIVGATTGDVAAARCGWKFGLAAHAHPSSSFRVEPVCAQLR